MERQPDARGLAIDRMDVAGQRAQNAQPIGIGRAVQVRFERGLGHGGRPDDVSRS